MTDKVQKIREEIARMHNLLPVMDGDNISVNYADRICTTLEMYIDSLQEELVREEQVKESLISKHEDKTCKENGNSLTQESASVWHDKNEEPKEDRQVLINLSDFCYVDFYHKKDKRFYMFGNPKHYLHEVDKWAYIDDLINNPKKEECEFKPTTSVWHKANDEKPIKGRKVVVLTGVSNVSDKDIAFAGEYIGGMYVQTYSCKEYMNSWAIWAYIEDMATMDRESVNDKLGGINNALVQDKSVQVDKAMAEVEEKAKAFTEAHKGESSEKLLAEMRGEEHVSEDLEKAAEETYKQHLKESEDIEFLDKHLSIDMFKAGAQWRKEQMMAKAVGVEVKVDDGGYPYIPQIELYDYDKDIPLAKEGDKYKVVLIKEE